MAIEAVMLSYNYSDDTEPAKILTVSSSGIKFSDRWILGHGSLIASLKQTEIIRKSNGKVLQDEEFYAKLPEIYATCEKMPTESVYDEVQELSRDRDARSGRDDLHPSYTLRVLTGRICHIWLCPMLERCASTIMHAWGVAASDTECGHQTALGKYLMSMFVLIDLDSEQRDFKVLRPLSALLDMVAPPTNRGSKIEIISTPFGCETFLNNVSCGRVSGVIGRRPTLLLTDAPTSLGSEGGPVFTADGPNKRLIAMVVSSVSWWRGEWVGLTLLAPLRSVLTAKLRVQSPDITTPRMLYPHSTLLENIDGVTVQVRCGGAWGAGVHLGRGLVLTAAHVVRNYEIYKVSVYCQSRSTMAIVRYKTMDDRAYDLALLFSDPQHWTHLKPAVLAKMPARKGEAVLAAGYPFFGQNDVEDLRPTLTTGHISNVSPSMVQTTCCVQSGFSGGPILRITQDQQVEVVAIITGNAETEQKAAHPYLNMAVPVHVFQDVLQQYQRDKDISRLQVMNNDLDIIQSQWKLMPYRAKI